MAQVKSEALLLNPSQHASGIYVSPKYISAINLKKDQESVGLGF